MSFALLFGHGQHSNIGQALTRQTSRPITKTFLRSRIHILTFPYKARLTRAGFLKVPRSGLTLGGSLPLRAGTIVDIARTNDPPGYAYARAEADGHLFEGTIPMVNLEFFGGAGGSSVGQAPPAAHKPEPPPGTPARRALTAWTDALSFNIPTRFTERLRTEYDRLATESGFATSDEMALQKIIRRLPGPPPNIRHASSWPSPGSSVRVNCSLTPRVGILATYPFCIMREARGLHESGTIPAFRGTASIPNGATVHVLDYATGTLHVGLPGVGPTRGAWTLIGPRPWARARYTDARGNVAEGYMFPEVLVP